jgi:hypothetical protein
MKTQTSPCCKGCRYYHGGDHLACAVHPYGPEQNACHDFEPSLKSSHRGIPTKGNREGSLDSSVISDYIYRSGIQSFFLKSLLVVYGLGIIGGFIVILLSPPRREPSPPPNLGRAPQESFRTLDQEVK